jgi:hypothetical protein
MQRIMSGLLTALLLGAVTTQAPAQRASNKNNVAAPTGIAFSYTATELTITWSPVAGALRYDLSRRAYNSVPEQLGHSDINNFRMVLPTRGVPYEYQVTAVGRISYTPSAWVPYTVPLETTTTTMTAVLVEPVTTGTAMVTPAGPAELHAISLIPGEVKLDWPLVTNAVGYKVLRSSSGGEVDRELPTPNGVPGSQYWAYWYIDAPVDFRWTYSYKVYAYVMSGSNQIQSAPSPAASANSLPFVQVSGLTYTLTPSTKTLGRLDVSISWNAVKDAEKYIVSDETWAAPKEFIPASGATTMSYTQPGVPTGYTFRVCVAAVYPYHVRQDSTAPCIDIKT